MAETITVPVELNVEQLVQAIRRLSIDRQRESLGVLENLFCGLLIAEAEDDEMLCRNQINRSFP